MNRETFYLDINHHKMVNIKIPICRYSYNAQKELENDLIEIIDDLEKFFIERNFQNPTSRFYISEVSSATGILSTCHRMYNILDNSHIPSIKKFRRFLHDCVEDYNSLAYEHSSEDLFIKCWANKNAPNDRTTVHNHIDRLKIPGIAGHYNFHTQENNTATRYMLPIDRDFKEWTEEILSLENEDGALVLFPRFLFHDTTNNRSQYLNRYSLGFTISKIKDDADQYNHCWIGVKNL